MDYYPQPDSIGGLNKSERLRLERLQTARDNSPPPLEADFPWSPAPFDPRYFGAAISREK